MLNHAVIETQVDSATKARPQRSWKLLIAKIGLSFGTVVGMFVLAEIGLRVVGAKPQTATVLSTYFTYSDQTGWIGRPNVASRFATTNFDVFITHDQNGLRACGIDTPIATDRQRDGEVVWCVGDSGTWGWGVMDNETYVARLNAMDDRGRRFRNFGTCGFSSVQQYFLLKKTFAEGLYPDRIVLLFCGNDLDENFNKEEQDPPRPYLDDADGNIEIHNHPTPASTSWNAKAWWKNNSMVFNYLNFYLKRFTSSLRQKPAMALDHRATFDEQADAIYGARQRRGLNTVYRRILTLCQEHDVEFTVAAWHEDEVRLLRSVCQPLDVPVLDLSWCWAKHASEAPSEPTCFKTDPHFNATGHRMLAEGIERGLNDLPMIQPAGHTPPARAAQEAQRQTLPEHEEQRKLLRSTLDE